MRDLKQGEEYIFIWIPDVDNWGGNEKLSLRILSILPKKIFLNE